MLAVSELSFGTQAALFAIALVAFIAGAGIAWSQKLKIHTLLLVGLAAVDFVWLWAALAKA